MRLVPIIGFVVVALAAIGFAAFPLWRRRATGGAVLALSIALFLLGIGGGTYWILGKPYLAQRAGEGLATRDIRGLVPFLIQRVRKAPDDLQGWIFLGRAYMTVNDPLDAARAYGRAVTVARLRGAPDAGLNSAYGEALVAQAGGTVPDEAMQAFTATLALDSRDPAARFFIAQGKAERGDRAGALLLWRGLMDETPVNSPLRQTLLDRIALLTAQGGMAGGAPDPRAMVAALAARLKTNPQDAPGWARLIRAYTVLGQRGQARAALDTARKTFAADRAALAALAAEARDLKLD